MNTLIVKDLADGRTQLTLDFFVDKETAEKLIAHIQNIVAAPETPSVISSKIHQLAPLKPQVGFQGLGPAPQAPTSPKRKNHKCPNCDGKTIKILKEECISRGIDVKGVNSKEDFCSRLTSKPSQSNRAIVNQQLKPQTALLKQPSLLQPSTLLKQPTLLQPSTLSKQTTLTFDPMMLKLQKLKEKEAPARKDDDDSDDDDSDDTEEEIEDDDD
jgi:hypothetical protein